jgi:hypothetical protein
MPDRSELLPLASILILWPFIFDTILTVVRRAFRRELIWQAHREHLYQRLVIAGLSHSKVTVIYGLFAVITSSAALLLFSRSTNLALAAIGLIIAISVLFALVVSKVYRNAAGLSNAANEAK